MIDDNTIKERYILTFLRDEISLQVLADILSMCHFGCTLDPDNKVQVAEYNVGVCILNRLGVFTADTQFDVINALSGVTIKLTEEIK
jgi:hypothetical protein